ncbi:uncharacterized protein LOC133716235 [Rosa rugosa]|uniref:uncharacterized protein LOC133716235 n=1 Tax=Rosa rugosa TaxID=74645 RepID=UPI002B40AE36|nr:uncharacterized protein LOC133716235 [Rosa rugosa]
MNSNWAAKWEEMTSKEEEEMQEEEEEEEEVDARLRIANKMMADAANWRRQSCDNAGQPSFLPHQKITCTLRMLANACSADSLDESFRMPESTAIENMGQFCRTIVTIYQGRYLRAPTSDDLDRLLQRAERRGFPGMIRSLDCMHWRWKNCPTGWQGSFSGKAKKPTIVLEAVADFDTWI